MRGWGNVICGECGDRGRVGRRGCISLFMKHYRLQLHSRYLIIQRLTVGYSAISLREVEVCESNS